MSRDVWVIDAVRTPIGRYGGALATVRPDDLAAIALRAVVERTGISPSIVEDAYLGAANQSGDGAGGGVVEQGAEPGQLRASAYQGRHAHDYPSSGAMPRIN